METKTKGILATISVVLGLGFFTSSWVGQQRLAADRANFRGLIDDSVSAYKESVGAGVLRSIEYNASVNEVLGGMHHIRALRQDSMTLPSIPFKRETTEEVRKVLQILLGETVKFRWQTNSGDYVALAIPKGKVRLRYNRNSAERYAIFRIAPVRFRDLTDLDFSSLTQSDFQQLVDRHVDEVVLICPDVDDADDVPAAGAAC
jgi:hypothetical protein